MVRAKLQNKLTCLFGYHDYSKRPTKDKYDNSIHLCKICKLNGYYKFSDKYESWYEYDDKSNIIHYKNSDGYESWYEYDDMIHYKNSDGYESWYDCDDKGNKIYYKYSNGHERWLHKGEWVDNKPEDWEHEQL